MLTVNYLMHVGLFLDDDEGTLTTTDVKAKFLNGKPQVRQCIEDPGE